MEEKDYIRIHKLNLELFGNLRKLNKEIDMTKGIIDVLWREVMTAWDREHSHLSGNELAQAREEYQISLTKEARENKE